MQWLIAFLACATCLAVAAAAAGGTQPSASGGAHHDSATVPVAIELVITGNAAADPFAQPDEPACIVRSDGAVIATRAAPMAVESPWLLEARALPVGSHELHVTLGVVAGGPAAARVRVSSGPRLLVERIIWAEAGEPLAGTLPLVLHPAGGHDDGR